MPTQTSGTISLSDIGQSWGSGWTGIPASHAINNYTRGGTYIPSIPFGNNQVTTPASASNMSFGGYYNVWQYKRLSFSMTSSYGTYATGKAGSAAYYGYSKAHGSTATNNPWNYNAVSAYGSISASTFVTPRGTMNINGLCVDEAVFGSIPVIVIGASTLPTDDDYSFIGIYNAYKSAILNRSARTASGSSGLNRNWQYSYALAWPTSGTYTCYVNYYG